MASKKSKLKSPTPSHKNDKSGKDVKDEKESLAFKILSPEQTKELEELDDIDALQEKMLSITNTEEHLTDLKTGSTLDYYVSAVWWAKEQNFTTEQISAFYTVVHTVLDNLQEKKMALLENLKEFKKMLVGIGVDHVDVSGGLGCFSIEQAKLISNYIHQSFFQHYKLFEFVASHTQAEEIIGTDLDIEVPPSADLPWPAPLEEAVSEEIFTEYIAPPPPSEEKEEEKKSEEELEAEKKAQEEAAALAKAESEKVTDLLVQLSTEEVKNIMNQVFDDMLSGLKTDIANKLRDKENNFINRINKVHKIAEK